MVLRNYNLQCFFLHLIYVAPFSIFIHLIFQYLRSFYLKIYFDWHFKKLILKNYRLKELLNVQNYVTLLQKFPLDFLCQKSFLYFQRFFILSFFIISQNFYQCLFIFSNLLLHLFLFNNFKLLIISSFFILPTFFFPDLFFIQSFIILLIFLTIFHILLLNIYKEISLLQIMLLKH